MPYKIVKKGGKKPYKIINKNTGRTVGSSNTRSEAESSVRARLAGEHGWHPTRKGKTKKGGKRR